MKQTNNQQKINEKGILDVLEAKVKQYKKEIIFVIGAVILIAIIGSAVSYFKNQAYQKQWGDLFLAELPIALTKSGEEPDLSKLEEYAAKNESSDAGAYAALTLGNAYYSKKDYEKAETYFKQALKNGNDELKPIAESSLIATFIAREQYQNAIDQAKSFEAKYKGHFLSAQVKTHKALAMDFSGDKEGAKLVYTEIIEQYPSSYSSALAELQSGVQQPAQAK